MTDNKVYGPYDQDTWDTLLFINKSLDKYIEWGYDKYERAYNKEKRIKNKMIKGEL